MIHSIRFSNFFSFEDETEISFVMDGKSAKNDKSFVSHVSETRLSKVLAVVGANGAGKTNLIKPLNFISWFISDSFFIKPESALFIRPHMLSDSGLSKFNLEFETEESIYRYELQATGSRVYYESLQVKTSRLWSTLFVRQWHTGDERYLIKQRNYGLPSVQLDKVRDKVSLISMGEQFGLPVAVDICKALRKRNSNISTFGRENFHGGSDVMEVSDYYYDNDSKRTLMVDILRGLDFGLKDVEIEKVETVLADGRKSEYLLPWGVHEREGKEFKMPLFVESSGTQAAYYLLTKLLPVLETGGLLIYDELEGDLHPHMLEPILSLFFNPKTNPHNAQIIFTTHSLEILNELQKCQIILVEKIDAVSEAWRLSEMEGVRSDDNFYAKYMSGTYGAVPHI